MKIKTLLSNIDIEIKDLHSDPLDGAEYYQKIMPSRIREKLILEANKEDKPELLLIVTILINHFDAIDRINKIERIRNKNGPENKI